MRLSDRLMRAAAFYISVAIFLITLPPLLAYSLGYRIDIKGRKLHKTGIISINSKPSGASVYINDKLCESVTPAQIENLNPGSYKVKVKREGFYPWEEELVVRPNMVTRAESIILFPVMQEVDKISASQAPDFFLTNKGQIYYFSPTGLYRSNVDGTGRRKLSSYNDWPKNTLRKRLSPDQDKLLYFGERDVVIIYLNADKDDPYRREPARAEKVLISEEPIIDVFWYTGSGYIIVVTEKYINVLELRGGGKRNIATLYKFSAKPRAVYYDFNNGSLYFIDRARDANQKEDYFVFRIDLKQKLFDYLMQLLPKIETEGGNAKK